MPHDEGTSTCVEWNGRRNETGYGIDGNRRAHRVAWERENVSRGNVSKIVNRLSYQEVGR